MKQQEVWDKIAPEWVKYRNKRSSHVEDFLSGKSGRILDLGCGAGRNMISKKNTKFYGVDFSKDMVKLARKNAKDKKIDAEFKVSDVTKIPYKDDFFDAVLFYAVIHCLNTENKRKKSLKEVYRVLKPGSEVLISSWGEKHRRLKNKEKGCKIPWTIKGEKYLRDTYIFSKNELENLVKLVGLEIIYSKEGKENTGILARKPRLF